MKYIRSRELRFVSPVSEKARTLPAVGPIYVYLCVGVSTVCKGVSTVCVCGRMTSGCIEAVSLSLVCVCALFPLMLCVESYVFSDSGVSVCRAGMCGARGMVIKGY